MKLRCNNMRDFQDYLPFWPQLSQDQQNSLTAAVNEVSFPSGTILNGGSKNCSGLFVVREGQLRAYTLSEEGREITLYRLFERDMCLFSAACIMNSLRVDVIISTEQNSNLLHIPPEIYKTLMSQSAAVANYTNEIMASRFSDVMWLLDQVLTKKIDSRLAAFLWEESQLAQQDTIKVTHEQIANHLGSAREVITRMLRYFQNEKLVKVNRGSITIIDRENLTKLAEASLR